MRFFIECAMTIPKQNPLLRALFLVLGLAFLALGIVGIVTPVLPTTPFLLLATSCFAKSSTRLHAYLIHHKTFGASIQAWQTRRAIPRRGKYIAWSMMTLSCAMLFYRLPNHLWLAWLTSAVCLATALWMARLPDA